MEGWLKLHRSIMDKAYYKKDSEKVHLWIHILISASHSGREEMFAGKPIFCNPGQFTTGRNQLSLLTGINNSKIERILTYFEKTEHQIEQQKSNVNRLITVLNWDKYQLTEQRIEQQVNNDRTTTEQQLNTLIECKNNIIVVDNKLSTCETLQPHDEKIDYKGLVDFFNSETGGVFGKIRMPLSESRKKMIGARIREYGKEQFAIAVKKAAKSDFMKGQNNRGWTATFDWMIKPTNFQKIIEGNYDNKDFRNNTKTGNSEDLQRHIEDGIARGLFERERRRE